jgi:hypothetical protein
MKTFKLSEATIGQRVVVVEPVGEEIRWKHFERIEGVAKFSPKYLCVNSLRAVQGHPGMKPRWDSGEGVTASEMPAGTPVVDAKEINHDWTEAHDGLVIVDSSGWLGFYVRQRLVHVITPAERPYHHGALELAESLINAVGDIPVGHAVAEWNGEKLLPDDLTRLRLRMRE